MNFGVTHLLENTETEQILHIKIQVSFWLNKLMYCDHKIDMQLLRP